MPDQCANKQDLHSGIAAVKIQSAVFKTHLHHQRSPNQLAGHSFIQWLTALVLNQQHQCRKSYNETEAFSLFRSPLHTVC